MSSPERMRSKLGDLATTITHAAESAPMPLDSTTVEDHIVHAAYEAMAEMRAISEILLRGGDRENAVRLQNARMTMKTLVEQHMALVIGDSLERRHLARD